MRYKYSNESKTLFLDEYKKIRNQEALYIKKNKKKNKKTDSMDVYLMATLRMIYKRFLTTSYFY